MKTKNKSFRLIQPSSIRPEDHILVPNWWTDEIKWPQLEMIVHEIIIEERKTTKKTVRSYAVYGSLTGRGGGFWATYLFLKKGEKVLRKPL